MQMNNKFINEKININSILQQTQRIDNNNPNIGIFNNTYNKVVIIQGKYSINPKQEISHPQIQGQAFQDVVGDVKSFQQQFQNLSLGQNHNNYGQNAQFGGNNQQFNCPNFNQVNQQPQKNVEIKQEIKLILNMIIDLKIIRTKRKWPFNQYTRQEKYYPINNKWISKFLEYYNLFDLYTGQTIHQIIDKIIFNSKEILSNEEAIENAKLQPEFINIINYFSMNIPNGRYAVSIRVNPVRININDFFYYTNFSLVSENTMKYLKNFISKNYVIETLANYCYLGDNKIVIAYNEANKKFLTKVYYLDKSYNILPEIFFKYYEKNDFNTSLYLMRENGLLKFFNCYLMFNNEKNDLASPIFDKNNKEIGYAYKYVPNINDYSPYIINSDYKTMLKLYFYYVKFHSQSISKNNGHPYLLINNEFFKKYKEHYGYRELEKILFGNKSAQQVVKNINEQQDYSLNDKMLTLIAKNLPNDMNRKFIEKSKYKVQTENIPEEPTVKGIPSSELFLL